MLAAYNLPPEAAPQERYVFKPQFGSSHHWAIGSLEGTVEGKRVLDIGAGGGAIGRALKSENPSELVGIELDPRARALLLDVYDEAYETVSPLGSRQFDIILLLDLLEHLADPFSFLRRLEGLLAPGGRVVISIPNIAHWSVRLPLLFGRFEYTSRGLLDRTHLQFFTRKRFKELVTVMPSCSVATLSSSIEPVELVVPDWLVKSGFIGFFGPVRKKIAEALPGLMAYQHLAVLRRTA